MNSESDSDKILRWFEEFFMSIWEFIKSLDAVELAWLILFLIAYSNLNGFLTSGERYYEKRIDRMNKQDEASEDPDKDF